MKKLLKKISFAIGIMFCSMNILCEEESDFNGDIVCDEITIVSESLFANLDSADFTFINAEIINNCLIIDIGASGCDSNTWDFQLIDSGAIAESLPEQRYLKFQLINEEVCLAYFQRTTSFDLMPLQIEGSNEILLNIEGMASSLTYEY